MKTRLQFLFLFVLLIGVVGFADAFADTLTIPPGVTVTVETDSTLTVDSDSPNKLTNKGTLNVQDAGKVIIKDEANMLNDCRAIVNLEDGAVIEIGENGGDLARLTNHGALNGPGQINLFGLVIEIKNSGFISAILNPSDIMEIPSPCMVVGGELIPLDSTALLLYYSQNTAAWMIPALVSAVGIGIVLARKV